MLPLCLKEGIGVVPWSPLARGLLAGKRRPGLEGDTARAKSDDYAHQLYTDSDLAVADRVVEVASRRGLAPATVALAWLLSRSGVVAPIVGATKTTHLEDAVAATGLELTEEECRLLEEPYRPHPVLGHE